MTDEMLKQIIIEELKLAILEEEKKKTDKDRMKCNSPRRIRKGEAGHGKKKFVVKACDGGTEKIIRYGDANMEIRKILQHEESLSELDTTVKTQVQS